MIATKVNISQAAARKYSKLHRHARMRLLASLKENGAVTLDSHTFVLREVIEEITKRKNRKKGAWVHQPVEPVDIWPRTTADERKRNAQAYRGVVPAGE